ncbi:TlpA family protein disulfide reductase [Nocardioides gilvus]|uniref:TlpA family protein disulfide reductase n=1 Tax=Nocardioides gilvus TaxID=1735589 RepID=UPI001EF6FE18|nr:thioredoxin family protein [Nocardioides gilvus]
MLVAVVLAVSFGLWRAATDGRFRGTHRVRGGEQPVLQESNDQASSEERGVKSTESAVAGTAYADQLGERATFLQFSSAFCAPCRATRRVLEEVTAVVPGVAHVEVDAESQLELVRRVNVMRTPTTLVLDASGREVTRATGAPTKQQVLAALALIE